VSAKSGELHTQKQMATAIGVSESQLADFLSARRGLSDLTFSKLEHVLSLNATHRKLQFYTTGNSNPRLCSLQAKGKNIKGQINVNAIDAVANNHAAFSKYHQNRMEA
jgi:transcriptional regulator with XRE-family HTH domain